MLLRGIRTKTNDKNENHLIIKTIIKSTQIKTLGNKIMWYVLTNNNFGLHNHLFKLSIQGRLGGKIYSSKPTYSSEKHWRPPQGYFCYLTFIGKSFKKKRIILSDIKLLRVTMYVVIWSFYWYKVILPVFILTLRPFISTESGSDFLAFHSVNVFEQPQNNSHII